ncbi:MAG: NAD(P)H-dependent oxidoreductase [Peptoniphilus sp.]|nr:NAD(P)H-dependent oxidoreductase [Peptoniphilus sp.]MDY3118800.1 NAD(P)H-dependent oxidoreductase [Peptoniphilus sp.]
MTKKIGLIVGSLRKESWNRKVAEKVQGMFPEGYEAEFIEIGDLPLFNEDYEKDKNEPESYARFRKELGEKDGYVFFTPEYNRLCAPAIKNAIDVGSRPYGKNQWGAKPAAVVSASVGASGGMAANLSLRQSLIFVDLIPLQQPEVYLSGVQNYFDKEGNLVEKTKNFLQNFVDAFVAHMDRF